MSISYRTRQALRRASVFAATVVAVLLVLTGCLFLWLQRFVVYTDHGAVLDFSRHDAGESQLPLENDAMPSVTLRYEDEPYLSGLQQLCGYYIPEASLMKDGGDIDAVLAKLQALPAGTAVMLDVKGYRGYFFYSTAVGEHTSGLYDIEKMDRLLQWLGQSELYVIARMSSLRDFVLVWDDSSYGLTTASGALYSDRGDYGLGYWLDPSSSATQSYLAAVINELKSMGFDEVVLDNFCFPDTDTLAFSADRAQALLQCADYLIGHCAEENFAVSFVSSDPAFSLPEGRCRLYLENIAAENAQAAWQQADIADKRRYLVFIAGSTDSRYNIENGLLQPLS